MNGTKKPITDAWLRENLAYDPETGILTRDGRALGNPDSKGYLRTQLLGNFARIHRLAWFLGHGHWPVNQIDHIDGDRLNNRLSNLRDVPCQVNIENRRHATGVKRVKRKFAAHIFTKGVRISLGSFDTYEGAHQAYLAARPVLHAGYAGP